MGGSMLWLAIAAVGIDVGWQPLPGGGLEYIIQIEPYTLERLKQGEEIASDLPPGLKGVRSYRITTGSKELPRRALPEPAVESLALPEELPALSPAGPALGSLRRSAPGEVRASAPRQLDLAPDPRPLSGQPASFVQPAPEVQHRASPSSATKAQVETIPPLAWTVTVGALMAAVGGMLYLGWLAWDYRMRYRTLLARMIDRGLSPPQGHEPP